MLKQFVHIVLIATLLFLSGSSVSRAQVYAGEDVTISGGIPVVLEATYTGYTGIPVTAQDDYFVGPFPIGFEFEFFGNTYTNFAIGPNGLLSFNLPDILDVVHWTNVTIPTSIFESTILGPYQDLFQRPGAPHNQFIYYQTVGLEPERKLIVGWCEAPMFSCESSYVTAQIVLNESDYSIENHLINKPACEANLGNRATMGLNRDDVLGVTVPGRNNTSWTAVNETWRYEPDGPDNYTVENADFMPEVIVPPGHISYRWYKDQYPGGEEVSTAQRFIVSPLETTTYYCEITLCGGLKYVDEVSIQVIPIPNAFNPDSPVDENRTFRVFANPPDHIINYKLIIFDRWGQKVFESNDIADGWDGQQNGNDCNSGVYVWVVYYDAGEGKVTNKGTVTLVR
ncbi:MAG: gliding motility-associated C-terminal domain-containing protein [Bacteroidetes bacterium]|nr:gliding motility-associated C-terminal domain-containing protein [Bacteroidota bacterium]